MGLSLGLGLGLSHQQSRPTFSSQQKKEIERIGQSFPGLSCQGSVGVFLDHWLICEALAKRLIMYHKKLTELPHHWTYEQVSAAIKHFRINIKPELNEKIFKGGRGKRGENTPRQIRNSYLHSLSPAEVVEIESRISEYVLLLEEWHKKVTKI